MLNTDNDLQKLLDTYDVVDKLKQELEEAGIAITQKPVFEKVENIGVTVNGEPIVPQDITAITLTDLGTLYSMCVSYLSFVTSQLAFADMELVSSEEKKDLVWAKIRQESEGTNSDKDDKVRTDRRYVEVNATYMRKKQKYSLIKEKHRHFETALKLISRELSRRTLEAEHARIEGNFDRRYKAGTAQPGGAESIESPFQFNTRKK